MAPVRAWRSQWRREIIETRADEADQQPARILVDDEPHIVDFISLGLRREGYEVRGAALTNRCSNGRTMADLTNGCSNGRTVADLTNCCSNGRRTALGRLRLQESHAVNI